MATDDPAPTGPATKKPKLDTAQHNTDESAELLAAKRATADNLPIRAGEWQAGDPQRAPEPAAALLPTVAAASTAACEEDDAVVALGLASVDNSLYPTSTKSAELLAAQRATADNLPLGAGEWQAGDLSHSSSNPEFYAEKNAVAQLAC